MFFSSFLLIFFFFFFFFFCNDTATTEIYTLSLHDALPIYRRRQDALRCLLAHRQRHRSRRRNRYGTVVLSRRRPRPLRSHRRGRQTLLRLRRWLSVLSGCGSWDVTVEVPRRAI